MILKRRPAMILAVLLAAVLLCACAQPQEQSAQLAEMQQQIEQQQAQLAALQEELEQAKQSQPPAAPKPDTFAPPSTPAPEPEAPPPAPAPASGSTVLAPPQNYDLPSLTTRVEAMVAQMETATAETLFDVLLEAKALENEIDVQDDALERDYRRGGIGRDDYRSIERQLEELEEQLDRAEDDMEHRLGYDD